jgi:tetratricopeptide (TPR) repeat protein
MALLLIIYTFLAATCYGRELGEPMVLDGPKLDRIEAQVELDRQNRSHRSGRKSFFKKLWNEGKKAALSTAKKPFKVATQIFIAPITIGVNLVTEPKHLVENPTETFKRANKKAITSINKVVKQIDAELFRISGDIREKIVEDTICGMAGSPANCNINASIEVGSDGKIRIGGTAKEYLKEYGEKYNKLGDYVIDFSEYYHQAEELFKRLLEYVDRQENARQKELLLAYKQLSEVALFYAESNSALAQKSGETLYGTLYARRSNNALGFFEELVEYIKGFAKKLDDSGDDLVHNTVSAVNTLGKALSTPEKTYHKIIEFMENFDSKVFKEQVELFFEEKWDTFINGTNSERGELAASFVFDLWTVIITEASYPAQMAKFAASSKWMQGMERMREIGKSLHLNSEEIKVVYFSARKLKLTEKYQIKDLVDYLGDNFERFVGDERGSIGLIGKYKPAPKMPKAFKNLQITRRKTPGPGGGLRKRWKDNKGNIFEWDSQHGRIEKYNKKGKHLGEFDADSGIMTKPADPTRKVEP